MEEREETGDGAEEKDSSISGRVCERHQRTLPGSGMMRPAQVDGVCEAGS